MAKVIAEIKPDAIITWSMNTRHPDHRGTANILYDALTYARIPRITEPLAAYRPPLHILTLALIPKTLEGYKNAEVPMWPVVRSKKETIIVITISSLISSFTAIAISILLDINIVINVIVIFVGVIMIGLSIVNLIKPTEKISKLIFKSASLFMVIAFLLWFVGKVI